MKIAAAAGAKVIATSSSDDKLEIAKQLGATHLVNYRTHPDWENEVLKVTDGKGADIAVEVVAGSNIEHTLKAIRRGGLVAFIGMLTNDHNKPVNVMPALWYGAKTSELSSPCDRDISLIIPTVQGFIGAGSKEMAEELSAFVQKHDLHPPIAETFEFEQAPDAWEMLKASNKLGKIVINV